MEALLDVELTRNPFGVLNKEKALVRNRWGFFFVAECNGISNLDLIRDSDRIIKLEEALSTIK